MTAINASMESVIIVQREFLNKQTNELTFLHASHRDKDAYIAELEKKVSELTLAITEKDAIIEKLKEPQFPLDGKDYRDPYA
jgi:hypothetical protein